MVHLFIVVKQGVCYENSRLVELPLVSYARIITMFICNYFIPAVVLIFTKIDKRYKIYIYGSVNLSFRDGE